MEESIDQAVVIGRYKLKVKKKLTSFIHVTWSLVKYILRLQGFSSSSIFVIAISEDHNREEKVKENPLFPSFLSKEISWDLESINSSNQFHITSSNQFHAGKSSCSSW